MAAVGTPERRRQSAGTALNGLARDLPGRWHRVVACAARRMASECPEHTASCGQFGCPCPGWESGPGGLSQLLIEVRWRLASLLRQGRPDRPLLCRHDRLPAACTNCGSRPCRWMPAMGHFAGERGDYLAGRDACDMPFGECGLHPKGGLVDFHHQRGLSRVEKTVFDQVGHKDSPLLRCRHSPALFRSRIFEHAANLSQGGMDVIGRSCG